MQPLKTNDHPTLLLGTAMWGWTTSRQTAFEMLDEWYAQGLREVDAATNYPIDKDPAHFRLAERILVEWIDAHGIDDLQVVVKVGSINNLRTPDHDLSKAFLLEKLAEYQTSLRANLATLMVHWDNRALAAELRETLEALAIAAQHGLRVGLSGIAHPASYAQLNHEFGLDFRIQFKHNLLQSDYGRYAPFHGQNRFIAYGINAGGLKLDADAYTAQSSLLARGGQPAAPSLTHRLGAVIDSANRHLGRPALSAMHELGMIYAFYQADMQGILLGGSSTAQLKSSIDFHQTLKDYDYSDVYHDLASIAQV